MKRVLFIGFSVTIQTNGYFDLLKKTLKDDYILEHYAIGGANLHSILYLLNDIPFEKFDIVVFEVSTSTRWLKNDYQRYKSIFDTIVAYALSKTNKVACLDLSRIDVDRKNDVLHLAIKDVCQERNILCASWEDSLEDILYDGIHPNATGIQRYAAFAQNLLHDVDMWSQPIKKDLDLAFFEEYNPCFVSVDEINIEGTYNLSFFEKGGVNKKLVVIAQENSIKLNFNKDYYINGILLKIGPTSSRLIINGSEEGEEVNKLPYDERSYYYRFLPLFFRMEITNTLNISSLHEQSRPKLLKGEENNEEQEISIAGFFLSNKRLPF